MGINLRMSHPENVAQIPIIHHDGLKTADDPPLDGRCVSRLLVLIPQRLEFGSQL